MGEEFRHAEAASVSQPTDKHVTAQILHYGPDLVAGAGGVTLWRFVQPAILLVCLWVSLAYLASAPLVLLAGAALGILSPSLYAPVFKSAASMLLGISITAIGVSSDFSGIMASADSLFIVLAMVVFSIVVGLSLGRALGVSRKTSVLIASGTAICGGSAIMATARAVDASEDETAVSLTTIFLFNALGLTFLPALATGFGLNEQQFGLWAALAIHDTGSVLAAALEFGGGAVEYATTVKLYRALFIMPMVVGVSLSFKSLARGKSRVLKRVPWFIPSFFIAAFAAQYIPIVTQHVNIAMTTSKICMLGALFLLGTTLTKDGLVSLGMRPFILGFCLWTPVAILALLVSIVYH